MKHGHLSEFVATALAAHAAHLAQHWLERAQAATPRRAPAPVLAGASSAHTHPEAASSVDALQAALDPIGARGSGLGAASDAPGVPADVHHAEQVVRAVAAGVLASTAASLVIAGDREGARSVLARTPPAQDARPAGEVMRLGWLAGGAAFAAGLSVHHVVRDADLLLAVVLADVERVVADMPAEPGATAADALAVARRLHRATGRYAQAAVSGFVHALLRQLRERYRLLRHDLRNPLGTIRSALSLMEDESVPAETRHGPRIRAMVARNAGSLDALIGRGLDDAAATALLARSQAVSLRDVALAARREVREATHLAGCEVVVDIADDEATSHVDGAALELTLTAVLLAAIARAAPGTTLRISCSEQAGMPPGTTAADSGSNGAAASWADDGDESVVVRVNAADEGDASPMDGHPAGLRWDSDGLALAVALAQDHGGRLGVDASVPVVRDVDALVGALTRAPAVYLRLPIAAP